MADKCDCGQGGMSGIHMSGCASLLEIMKPGEVQYFGECSCGVGDLNGEHEAWCTAALTPGVRIKPPGLVQKREGVKFITELPDNEQCVGMLMFKDTMYVATCKGVYKMVGDNLEPVQFVVKEED